MTNSDKEHINTLIAGNDSELTDEMLEMISGGGAGMNDYQIIEMYSFKATSQLPKLVFKGYTIGVISHRFSKSTHTDLFSNSINGMENSLTRKDFENLRDSYRNNWNKLV